MPVGRNLAVCQRGNVYLIWHLMHVRKFQDVIVRVVLVNIC